MKFDDTMETQNVVGSSYSFSAVRPEALGAMEYTLVNIIVDVSGSVMGWSKELLDCLKEAVRSCNLSPRAENLLIRLVAFNSSIGLKEIHGFKLLKDIEIDDYQLPRCESGTPLYDAVYNGIGATLQYADTLYTNMFTVNALTVVITDGDDNDSRATPNIIHDVINNAVSSEKLESITTILIGINAKHCTSFLNTFANNVGFTQFIDAGDANAKSLAKVANFISKSISSSSQSLNNGQSATVTF